MAPGFLFRTTKRTSVTSSPFLASAAQARLVTYLKSLNIYDKESVHGFRGGTAVLLSLLGASKEEIAGHIGWRSIGMVDHYAQVDKVLAADVDTDPAERLSASMLPKDGATPAGVLGNKFRDLNNLTGLTPFFY